MIEAKVIADSISEQGKRITTLQVKFHRFILPEFNTHRVFSRNFSSSRAIPTAKLIEQVKTKPAMPVHWGRNQPGMQAKEELSGPALDNAMQQWQMAAEMAAGMAEHMAAHGAHKQIVNRILEPYLYVTGIVTSAEYDNWDDLRAHEDAQPEIHALALKMKEARNNSTPELLRAGEWHLPYIQECDWKYLTEYVGNPFNSNGILELAKKVSAARCCRVSYLKHDGTNPKIEDDLALFDRLADAVPIHASPLEHQATPDIFIQDAHDPLGKWLRPSYHGNFTGWIQFRKQWEQRLWSKNNV